MRKLLVVALIVATGSCAAPFDTTAIARQRDLAHDRPSKKPATFDDVVNVKAVQNATVLPDGAQGLYTVAQWEQEQDRMERRTRVWRAVTNGGIAEFRRQKDRMQRIYDWLTKYTLGAGGNSSTSK